MIEWLMSNSTNLIALGGLVTLLGGLLTVLGIVVKSRQQHRTMQEQTDILKDNVRLANELTRKSEDALRKSDEQLQYVKENARLANQLSQKSEEITGLNKYIKEYVTGANSYPFVTFFPADDDSKNIYLSLTQEGVAPVDDVSVKLMDINVWDEGMREKNEVKMRDSVREYNGGTVVPGVDKFLQPAFPFQRRQLVRLKAYITSKLGMYIQMIHGRKIGENWQFGFRLDSLKTNKVKIVKEYIPEGFPLNSERKYDWNSKE